MQTLLALAPERRSIPLLTGPQGIGKTSILTVLGQALAGFEHVLEAFQLEWYALRPANRLVIWTRCDHLLTTPEQLANRILEGIARSIQVAPESRAFALREFSITAKAPIGEVAATWERAQGPDATAERNLVSLFDQLGAELGVVTYIMLDECEKLPWLSELFGFVSRFDHERVQFVMAMRDHAVTAFERGPYSGSRWPKQIAIRRLSEEGMRAFFADAAVRLRSAGVHLLLDPLAFSEIAQVSDGDPWCLQLLGHQLLAGASEEIRRQMQNPPATIPVGLSAVHAAGREVVRTRLASAWGGLYADLSDRAPRREEVMRAMATFPGTVIPAGFVRHLRSFRGGQPQRTVDSLVRAQVLVPVEGPTAGWEFVSHQFRVYCRLAEASNVVIANFAQRAVQSWDC